MGWDTKGKLDKGDYSKVKCFLTKKNKNLPHCQKATYQLKKILTSDKE